MKKLFCFALCAIMFAACKENGPDDPTPNPTKPGDITFSATIARAAQGDLALADINFALAANDPVSVVFNGSSAASSYKVASISDGTATLTGSLKWPAYSTSYGFYAYINGGSYSDGNVNVPGPVFSGDGDNSHIKSSMLLVAAPVEATSCAKGGVNNPVGLEFHSLMSVIEVSIAAEDSDVTISNIEITAGNGVFPTDGKVDVSAEGAEFGKITSTAKSETTSLAVSGNPAIPVADDVENPTNGRKFFIPAAAVGDSGDITVTVTTNNGPKTFEVDGITFALGKLYNIGILIEGETVPIAVWDGKTRTEPGKDPADTGGKTYLIGNGEHLAWISYAFAESAKAEPAIENIPVHLEGLTFKFTDNIDLGNHDWDTGSDPDDKKSYQIGSTSNNSFKGTIDGNGYAIRNFYWKVSARAITGLVRANQGTVKNLTMYGKIEGAATVASITNIGVFAGRNEEGTGAVGAEPWRGRIENCHSYVDIDVANVSVVGGIASESGRGGAKGLILNCTNHGNIKVTAGANGLAQDVGGIVGRSQSPETPSSTSGVVGCANYGSVTSDMAWVNSAGVGGVCGALYSGTLQQCKNHGNVTSAGNAGGVVGRLGQALYAKVIASYNTGEIKATAQTAGGVIGYIHRTASMAGGSMIACYSVGKVAEGTNYGAVCGHALGTIKTSFYGGDAPAIGVGLDEGESVSVNQFSASAWPATTMEGWATGSGGYWQSLGSAPDTWPTLP